MFPRVRYILTSTASQCLFFFFNDTATTEIYTLSLHDALPISFSRTFRTVRSPAVMGEAGRAAQRFLDQQKRNGLKWAAGLLRPKAAAALAATRLDLGNFRPGRGTMLCLTRPHFSLDVEQLRKLDHLNWIGLNLILLGEMQRAWARPQM